MISWVGGRPLRVGSVKDCKWCWKPHLRIFSERYNLRAKQGGGGTCCRALFVTENSLLNYCTILCGGILPYVVVFVFVIVLYKYICFDLRATVGCFIASNLANLPQRLFLNATCGIQDISRHILATAHVKSQTQAEFELVWCLVLKAFAGRSGLVLMFVGKAGWHNLRGYRWT